LIFFEFLHNIFFGCELLKDEEIMKNDDSGCNILIQKNHVFGSAVTNFHFRVLRPIAIERACECGSDIIFSSFYTSYFFIKVEKPIIFIWIFYKNPLNASKIILFSTFVKKYEV